MRKMKKTRKPMTVVKAVVTYVICGVLICAMLVGAYYADVYRDLITVYLSGSGTVTTDKSEDVCRRIEEEGMVLLKNEDAALPLASGAKISLFGQDSVDFVYGGAGVGPRGTPPGPGPCPPPTRSSTPTASTLKPAAISS